jgi:hypothetical protein
LSGLSIMGMGLTEVCEMSQLRCQVCL